MLESSSLLILMFFAGIAFYWAWQELFKQPKEVSYVIPTYAPVKGRLDNNLNEMVHKIFYTNLDAGWWTNHDLEILTKQDPFPMHKPRYSKEVAILAASKIALCHSELSEALEGMRKGLADDHLTNRPMIEVELADTIIRILDLAGYLKLDIGGAVTAKFQYNQERADHKKENREAAGGKTI